jgi:positive regulator of sigma E activity
MRVTNEQAKILCAPQCGTECQSCIAREFCGEDSVYELAADLLEARELIKEMSQTLLTISQYPIAFVCEDVRTLARNEWEKSKEYV